MNDGGKEVKDEVPYILFTSSRASITIISFLGFKYYYSPQSDSKDVIIQNIRVNVVRLLALVLDL